jgi:gamma-glutamylcyclotransferase (GGCT)/AIG2-like uncharacterized protein YtfP
LLGAPASLPGYVRYRIIDRVYPAIVAAPGWEVPGLLYSAIDADELQRLDDYEGPLYERRIVSVRGPEGALDVSTYVLRAQHGHRLSREPWDLDEFERDHLESYLERISATARAP